MTADFKDRLWEENPDALVALSGTGVVLHWNRAAEKIFGYAADEAIGRSLDSLIVPADRADEEKRGQEEALAAGLVVYESLRRRKDGTLVHVSVSTKAIRDADGRLQYFLSNKKDVTHLKVLRDARVVEARFSNLLESTPDAIVMVNVTGRVVMVNSQAERMFGRLRADLIGKPVEALLPSRYRSAHHGHRGAFFAQPRTRAMGAGLELYGLRFDGEEFPVEISLSPIETEEGTMVMSAIRDVTERKRLEQALRDKNLELERAASVKDHFFASMSHELRTPLNAIIGFTGTLLMKLPGPLNPEQEKQLRIVQTGARHLLSLINDLLDLAKLGANKVDLKVEDVDCLKLIEEVAATLRHEAEAKDLTISVIPPDAPLSIRTDRRALSQIMINLAGNAVKFTDQGSVSIRLDRAGDANAPGVSISVEDTGPGIAPGDQARLFEAFSRGEAAGRREVVGTGLGLHLSRRLAQALGGDIGFRTEMGKGSVFTLDLPRNGPAAHMGGH